MTTVMAFLDRSQNDTWEAGGGAPPNAGATKLSHPRKFRRFFSSSAFLLGAICTVFAVISLRVKANPNPFQDEGLYLYIGHRMIDHIVSGANVSEYPGAYLSGAPGMHPIVGAIADSVAGLDGARLVSLFFTCIAIVATYGIGKELFGRLSGLLGAGAFALCGSVIFISHLATMDAMALCLMALACWLTVCSANHDKLLWAPIVGLTLTLAFLTKYATAVYVPGIAAIGMLLAWRHIRWGALRRAYLIVTATAASVFFILNFWAADLKGGIVSTTASRIPLNPTPRTDLIWYVVEWVGPWLLVAVLGALTQPRRWRLSIVLLAMSVIGPLQQIRTGEVTSLSKHVAFGIVFAAPLIGSLLVWIINRSKWVGLPITVAVAAVMVASGTRYSQEFLTTWVDDREIIAQLREELAIAPHKAILGEEPSAQRYALRTVTAPEQWNDTFVLLYGHKTGLAAYREAIDQSHFGTIYLTLDTVNGRKINEYLTNSVTPYRLSGKVPFYRYGKVAGYYLVWTPKVLNR
jgi:4-amino-4-deoxy-L-arabinose transferase-like glycosyltransferase